MNKEIERKFLLKSFPDNNFSKTKDTRFITQSYVSLTENAEVRIRKEWTKYSTNRYVMTYKNGNGLVREEVEFEIDKDTYEDLLGNSTPINKTRHYYDIDGVEVSIDVYTGSLHGLFILEVEFDSVEKAVKFNLPIEHEKEVTEDKRYKNKNLWKETQ